MKMEKNKVYAFKYCSCIYESADAVMSLHKTKKGAEMAMEFHKQKEYEEWKSMYPEGTEDVDFKFGEYERWSVEELEILDL